MMKVYAMLNLHAKLGKKPFTIHISLTLELNILAEDKKKFPVM